jgi:hypothetical protein
MSFFVLLRAQNWIDARRSLRSPLSNFSSSWRATRTQSMLGDLLVPVPETG